MSRVRPRTPRSRRCCIRRGWAMERLGLASHQLVEMHDARLQPQRLGDQVPQLLGQGVHAVRAVDRSPGWTRRTLSFCALACRHGQLALRHGALQQQPGCELHQPRRQAHAFAGIGQGQHARQGLGLARGRGRRDRPRWLSTSPMPSRNSVAERVRRHEGFREGDRLIDAGACDCMSLILHRLHRRSGPSVIGSPDARSRRTDCKLARQARAPRPRNVWLTLTRGERSVDECELASACIAMRPHGERQDRTKKSRPKAAFEVGKQGGVKQSGQEPLDPEEFWTFIHKLRKLNISLKQQLLSNRSDLVSTIAQSPSCRP